MTRRLLAGRRGELSHTLTMYCYRHQCEVEFEFDPVASGPANGFQATEVDEKVLWDHLWTVFVEDWSGAYCPKALTEDGEENSEKCFESWSVAVVVEDDCNLVEVPDRYGE